MTEHGRSYKVMGAPAVDRSKDYTGAVAFPINATEKQEDFRLIGSCAAALFIDGELVMNNCGLEVEYNGRA